MLGCHKPVIAVVIFPTPLLSNIQNSANATVKGLLGHAFMLSICKEDHNINGAFALLH